MTDTTGARVGFIGAGRMATALAKGLAGTFTDAGLIAASDPHAEARSRFESETGATAGTSNVQVADSADIVILAVKPHLVRSAAADIATVLTPQKLVLSVAAGVQLETLIRALGGHSRTVRVMPNTPCLVGAGACAIAVPGHLAAEDEQTVRTLLETVGRVTVVPEPLLDAITGLSGSGPAFVYQVIEALSDGGVKSGLPRDIATEFAAQTVLGAARMVLETGQHPGALKDAVTSPGGTTIAGVHELEKGGLRGTLMSAVVAATERSRELG